MSESKAMILGCAGTSLTRDEIRFYRGECPWGFILFARNISEAKKKVLEPATDYVMPIQRKDITVLGRTGLGALYVAAHSLNTLNSSSLTI